MALEGRVEPTVEQKPEGDIEGDHERDRGREGAIELLLRLLRPLPVEVEARQVRSRDLIPCCRRDGSGREAGGRHQGFLGAGDDHVETPLVHLERHRAEARHRVDDDERTGVLGDGAERLHVRHHPGRGFGLDEEDERDRLDRLELLA